MAASALVAILKGELSDELQATKYYHCAVTHVSMVSKLEPCSQATILLSTTCSTVGLEMRLVNLPSQEKHLCQQSLVLLFLFLKPQRPVPPHDHFPSRLHQCCFLLNWSLCLVSSHLLSLSPLVLLYSKRSCKKFQ